MHTTWVEQIQYSLLGIDCNAVLMLSCPDHAILVYSMHAVAGVEKLPYLKWESEVNRSELLDKDSDS